MADPFQNVDAAGPEFIKLFADSMDARQSHPVMERIVAAYLDHLDVPPSGLVVEVGAGAGAVARRIAERLSNVRVLGLDPSEGFVAEARDRGAAFENLSFDVADGADLPLADGETDALVLHTVLSHVVDPQALVEEAARVLREGGRLVLCDADFSKASMASFANDPLDACAKEFVRTHVTDPHIVGKLRDFLTAAGLRVVDFTLDTRLVSTPDQMRSWVDVSTAAMVERGDISRDLADALLAEHDRRGETGTLYGHQVFATAIGEKDVLQ